MKTATLPLTQQELNLLHSALLNQLAHLRDLTPQLEALGLPTGDARTLTNQLTDLSGRMCDLMTE